MNQHTQNTFRALADPTRRMILMHLSQNEMTIGDVTNQFGMTRAAIKKHLTILETGKLISVRRAGRERINKLEPEALRSVADWLGYFEQFWDSRMAALEAAIDTHNNEEKLK